MPKKIIIKKGELSAILLKKYFGDDIEFKDSENHTFIKYIFIKGTYFGYIDEKGELGDKPHLELAPKPNRFFCWDDPTETVRHYSSYGFIKRFNEVKKELKKEFKWT